MTKKLYKTIKWQYLSRMEVYSPKANMSEGRPFKRTRSKLVLLYNET